MGAQISAPLLPATPSVHEIGTRHKPLVLRLYSSDSCKERKINNSLLFSIGYDGPFSSVTVRKEGLGKTVSLASEDAEPIDVSVALLQLGAILWNMVRATPLPSHYRYFPTI